MGRAFEMDRRELSYVQAAELAIDAVTWLLECGVKKLFLEHVGAVFFQHGLPVQAAMGIATDQVRTARMATSLALSSLAKGIEVVPVSAQTWRARVVGKSNPKDDVIAPAVAAGFDAFPAVTNVHVRDAAGLALFGLMPPLEVKPEKVSRAPKRPRDPNAPKPVRVRNRDESKRKRYDEANRVAARKQAREQAKARRIEAGCDARGCPKKGRHKKGCPLSWSVESKSP
jgi:hypothetical protein